MVFSSALMPSFRAAGKACFQKCAQRAITIPLCLDNYQHFDLDTAIFRGITVHYTSSMKTVRIPYGILEPATYRMFAATLPTVQSRGHSMKDRQHYLERRVDQLSRLMEVSHSIASRLDLEPLLQEIVDVATRLIGAELGGLLVLSQEKDHPFDFFTVYGWPYPINNVPKGTGLFAAPLRDGQPLRVVDVRQHPKAVGMPPDHPRRLSIDRIAHPLAPTSCA